MSTVSDLTVGVALLCKPINQLCARVESLIFAMNGASRQSTELTCVDHSDKADYAERCHAIFAKCKSILRPMSWCATQIILATVC